MTHPKIASRTQAHGVSSGLPRSNAVLPGWLCWERHEDPPAQGCEFSEVVTVQEGVATAVLCTVSHGGRRVAGLLDELRACVHNECLLESSPARLVNTFVGACRGLAASSDTQVSLVATTIDGRNRTLSFANVSQPPPLLWDGARLLPSPLEGTQWQVPLGPGYRLFLYNQGLVKASGPQNLLDTARAHMGAPGAQFVATMRQKYLAYSKHTKPTYGLSLLWLGEGHSCT